MSREILAIAGLEKTTPEFRREMVAVADRLGLNPSYLAAVMSFETGQTFDPTKTNPYSGCIGLIQFCMPETVGTTRDELRQMSAVEQLEYVERHYKRAAQGRPITSLEDHYLAVLAPACIGFPPSTKMPCVRQAGPPWSRPEGGCPDPVKSCREMPELERHECIYCQNPLDSDGDGYITTHEATAPVRRIVNNAQGKPPIIVDDAPPGPGPGPGNSEPPGLALVTPAGIGLAAAVPLLAGAALGYLAVATIAKKVRRRA